MASFEQLRKRRCFLRDGSKESFQCWTLTKSDNSNGGIEPMKYQLSSARELGEAHSQISTQPYHTCLYALHQSSSFDRINITEQSFQRIFQQHHINLDFLQLFSAFYEKLYDIEGSWCPRFLFQRSGTILEYGYVMKYADVNNRHGLEQWSLRQLAFYHQYDELSKKSVVIVLTPLPPSQSTALELLLGLLQSIPTDLNLQETCFMLNRLFLRTYLGNWRDYMYHYETLLDDLAHKPFEPGPIEGKRVQPEHMESLYFLETRFVPLGSAFSSLRGIVHGLRRIHCLDQAEPSTQCEHMSNNGFMAYESEEGDIWSYEDNLKGLLKRWSSTVELMNTTLSLRHQRISLQQNRLVTDSTTASLDVAASIHLITVITLIYLSFTGVATILDMPFFSWDGHGPIQTSGQLWIYFALSLPLTICTVGYWWYKVKARKRAQKHDTQVELVSLA